MISKATVRVPGRDASEPVGATQALLEAYELVRQNDHPWVEVRTEDGLRLAYWLRDSQGRLKKRD